jgi:hypothetical protein
MLTIGLSELRSVNTVCKSSDLFGLSITSSARDAALAGSRYAPCHNVFNHGTPYKKKLPGVLTLDSQLNSTDQIMGQTSNEPQQELCTMYTLNCALNF